MKNSKKKMGISLIVLVITILVMIILATAVILTLQDSEILPGANDAKELSDTATLKEAANTAYSSWQIAKARGKKDIGEDIVYVKNELKKQGFTDDQVNSVAINNGTLIVYEKQWTLTTDVGEAGISVGDLITFKEKTTEQFYVISVDGDNVAMLAAKNITTDTLKQNDSAPTVPFSSTNYWSSYTGDYPLDLNTNYTSSVVNGDAIDLAKKYAKSLGEEVGATGRLLTVEEIEDEFGGNRSNSATTNGSQKYSFINEQNYWLGSADVDSSVWLVFGGNGGLHNGDYNISEVFGVRPVIEISKLSIE